MCLAGKSTRQTLPRQGEVFFMHCSSMLTKKKHFLIYLGQRPETDEVLLAAVITSQLAEQEKIVRDAADPNDVLIKLSPNDLLPYLNRPSAIDCGSLVRVPQAEFKSRLKSRDAVPKGVIPDALLEHILCGTGQSRRVSTANRRMIGSDAALLRRNAREIEARALAQKTGNKAIAKISFD